MERCAAISSIFTRSVALRWYTRCMETEATTITDQEQTIAELRAQVATLTHQLEWFKRQVFGSKSEKRVFVDPGQMSLGDILSAPVQPGGPEPAKKTVGGYERGKAPKDRGADSVNATGLRFDASVPVEVIRLPVPEIAGLSEHEYEIVGVKEFCKLAQRPASYVVLRYERPVIKLKASGKLLGSVAPKTLFDGSIADVSLVAGLIVDKFRFHIPLYRQHQRMDAAGITLARSTLTNLVQRGIMTLSPIVDAQFQHVLLSKTLAMDEVPIKVGPKNKSKGATTKSKMNQGYYWPIYGEDDEVVFTYSESRARLVIEQLLTKTFDGTLISDGYSAYACYAKLNDKVTHAQCWTHTRRTFVEAENDQPTAVAEVLQMMQALYKAEEVIRTQALAGELKRAYRLRYSKPVVDRIFEWSDKQCENMALLPQSPFAKALNYLRTRKDPLMVYLDDPDVPIDTNHIERVIRPIPMGRRNWLFCWTELGAQHVGIIQSLITTCRLHGVDPYTYLVDVLQRVSVHPAKNVIELTPRVWKTIFAADPMRSDLGTGVKQ